MYPLAALHKVRDSSRKGVALLGDFLQFQSNHLLPMLQLQDLQQTASNEYVFTIVVLGQKAWKARGLHTMKSVLLGKTFVSSSWLAYTRIEEHYNGGVRMNLGM